MGNSITLISFLLPLLLMLVSFETCNGFPRTPEPFSVSEYEHSRKIKSTTTKNVSTNAHDSILPVSSVRTKRNLLQAPSSGFTWLDGSLYPVDDIFYRPGGNRDALKESKPNNEDKVDTRFDESTHANLPAQNSQPASFSLSGPKLNNAEKIHDVPINLQAKNRNQADVNEKERLIVTKRPISANPGLLSFLTDLVPPNPENFAVRHTFDVTKHSTKKNIPVNKAEFLFSTKQRENIFSPKNEKDADKFEVNEYTQGSTYVHPKIEKDVGKFEVNEYTQGSTYVHPKIEKDAGKFEVNEYIQGSTHVHQENKISKIIHESNSGGKDSRQSFRQIPVLPQELYSSSIVNKNVRLVTPMIESVLPPEEELNQNVPSSVIEQVGHDVLIPKIDEVIQLESSAVEIPSKEDLTSLTNSFSSIEYVPIEKQNSVPSIGSFLSIEPSYTHLPDLKIEATLPTPPLPSEAKSSSTNVTDLNDGKIVATVVYEPDSLSNTKTFGLIPIASKNPLPIEGLVPKSEVSHLLNLEVNRYEEKERSHPPLLNLSPGTEPEYNRVSLLNRLKKLSHSNKFLQNNAPENSSLTGSTRYAGFENYVRGNLGSSDEIGAGPPTGCDCSPRVSYKTLVVVDDEVIGTYGLNGFRKRNFDFGTAWKNFPTTTIEWPASVKDRLSSIAPSCGRVTSISTETYFHTEVRPQDVVFTHTRTRTLFTVVTRTVTKFRRF